MMLTTIMIIADIKYNAFWNQFAEEPLVTSFTSNCKSLVCLPLSNYFAYLFTFSRSGTFIVSGEEMVSKVFRFYYDFSRRNAIKNDNINKSETANVH